LGGADLCRVRNGTGELDARRHRDLRYPRLRGCRAQSGPGPENAKEARTTERADPAITEPIGCASHSHKKMTITVLFCSYLHFNNVAITTRLHGQQPILRVVEGHP